MTSVLRRLFIAPIRMWQRTRRFRPASCKFTPSCSEYTAQAIEMHGVVRGIALGAWRILRCNPWSHGGHDPVPQPTGQGPAQTMDDVAGTGAIEGRHMRGESED